MLTESCKVRLDNGTLPLQIRYGLTFKGFGAISFCAFVVLILIVALVDQMV